jgi:hypothetical protein
MITGYFSSATELEKLVQSKLLPGIVPTIYEVGQLLPMLPITTVDCHYLKWNKESTLPSVSAKSRGEQYAWQEVAAHSQSTLYLKEFGDQWALTGMAQETYKDPNDYRAIMTKQIIKGALRTIEDKLIYGDATTYTKEFDGLDKLCPATGGHAFGANQDKDAGGSSGELTIADLLELMRMCKPKPSFILMPPMIKEKLFIYSMGKAGAIVMARSPNEFGKMVETVNGVPIVTSDYLTYENDNTGGKTTSGNLRSIYAIYTGKIESGGVCLCVGGQTGGRDFFEVNHFEKLEAYNAEGIRAYCYCALACGSGKSISRIHSCDQTAAVTDTG